MAVIVCNVSKKPDLWGEDYYPYDRLEVFPERVPTQGGIETNLILEIGVDKIEISGLNSEHLQKLVSQITHYLSDFE